LAAGAGKRFGSHKLLADIDGQALVLHSANALAVCDSVIAVVRDGDHELHQLLSQAGIATVINLRPEDGIGSSIAAGVQASAESAGWCILPADMPAIRSATTQAIVAALLAGAPLAAPYYRNRRGHPVGFSKSFKDDLCSLSGDIGARRILAAHTDELERVDVDNDGILQDIDRPADLPPPRPG